MLTTLSQASSGISDSSSISRILFIVATHSETFCCNLQVARCRASNSSSVTTRSAATCKWRDVELPTLAVSQHFLHHLQIERHIVYLQQVAKFRTSNSSTCHFMHHIQVYRYIVYLRGVACLCVCVWKVCECGSLSKFGHMRSLHDV